MHRSVVKYRAALWNCLCESNVPRPYFAILIYIGWIEYSTLCCVCRYCAVTLVITQTQAKLQRNTQQSLLNRSTVSKVLSSTALCGITVLFWKYFWYTQIYYTAPHSYRYCVFDKWNRSTSLLSTTYIIWALFCNMKCINKPFLSTQMVLHWSGQVSMSSFTHPLIYIIFVNFVGQSINSFVFFC